MKMISIDDLIKYCDNERAAYKANNCGAACTALRRVEEFAKEYAVEAEPDNDWISVDDRLPEIKEHYRSELVICYSPDGEHECLFDYYEMNGFGQGCFTAEKYFGITITHWQPLPKRPKGEELWTSI